MWARGIRGREGSWINEGLKGVTHGISWKLRGKIWTWSQSQERRLCGWWEMGNRRLLLERDVSGCSLPDSSPFKERDAITGRSIFHDTKDRKWPKHKTELVWRPSSKEGQLFRKVTSMKLITLYQQPHAGTLPALPRIIKLASLTEQRVQRLDSSVQQQETMTSTLPRVKTNYSLQAEQMGF